MQRFFVKTLASVLVCAMLFILAAPGGVFAASVPVDSSVPAQTGPYAVVLAAYLNVRTGPGPNYAIVGVVSGGDNLPIIGRTNDQTWYQVQSVYGSGWVYAPYVAVRNLYTGIPVTTSSAVDAAVAGPIGVINTGALNIRSGPGPQYTRIGTLAGGTETQIIGRTRDWSWWLLATPLGNGWASALYVIARGDISSVPYVAPGTSTASAPGQSAADSPAPVVAGPQAVVITGALNIRSGPNGSFDKLGSVYAGTRMAIIGQSQDRGWWYVESPFGNGWVSKLYILVNGSTSGIPVVQ